MSQDEVVCEVPGQSKRCSARSVQACDESKLNRVLANGEDDRVCRGPPFLFYWMIAEIINGVPK